MAESPESRQRLLDAAVELVLEHHRDGGDLRAAFGYLTPGAVARRAGLSRALIYHHWGDGDDAVGGLLAEVAARLWQLETDIEGLTPVLEAVVAEVAAGRYSLSDVVVSLSRFEMDRVAGSLRPAARASQTLLLYRLITPGDVEAVIEDLSLLYAVIGDGLGMEPVPPLTWNDVAFAVSTIVEGFVYGMNVREPALLEEHDWTPAGPPPLDGKRWTLYAIVVESMFRRMLRPVG